MRQIKRRCVVCAFIPLFAAGCCLAQGVRIDSSQAGNAIPGAHITICSDAHCNNLASTYSSVSLASKCPTDAQLVLAGRPGCIGYSDATGAFGFWLPSSASTYYRVTDPRTGRAYGPYAISQQPAGAPSIRFQQPGAPPFAEGSVPRDLQSKLSDSVYVQDFGAVCDAVQGNSYTWTGTPNYKAVSAAVQFVTRGDGGGTVKSRTGPGKQLCGIEHTLTIPQGVTLDFENPNTGGLVPLKGGTFSTYYHSEGSHARTTYLVGIGPPNTPKGCPIAAVDRAFIKNMYLDGGNGTVQTVFHSACAEEQTGLENVLIAGVTQFGADLNSSDFATQNFGGFRHMQILSTYGTNPGQFIGIQYEYQNARSVIENVTIAGTGGTSIGIHVDTGSNVTIIGLHDETTTYGVKIDNGSSAVLVGPATFYHNGGAAIYLANNTNFTGHSFQETAKSGVPHLVQDYNYRNGAILEGFGTVGSYISSCNTGPPAQPCTGSFWTDAALGIGTPDTKWIGANPALAQTRDINALFTVNNQILGGYLSVHGLTFAALGTPSDGTVVYCVDCKAASSSGSRCISGGSGGFAFRVRGTWKCF